MLDTPEPAVRVRDRACGASKRLANDVWNDARSRAAADDKVDGAAACEVRPRLWGRTEDGARGFRSKPRHDLAEAAAVAPDQRFCGRAERSDDARHSTDGIDESLKGEVAVERLPTAGGIRRVVVEAIAARIGGRCLGRSGYYVATSAAGGKDESEGRLGRDKRWRRERHGAKNGWLVWGRKERAGQRRSGELVRSRRDALRIVDFQRQRCCVCALKRYTDLGQETGHTGDNDWSDVLLRDRERDAVRVQNRLLLVERGSGWSASDQGERYYEGESQKGGRPNRARSHALEVRSPEARGLDWLRRSAPGRRRLTAQTILERSFGGRSSTTTSSSPR